MFCRDKAECYLWKKSGALYVHYYELWLPKSLGRLCGECKRFSGESRQKKGQRALLLCALLSGPLIRTHSATNTHGELFNCLMGAICWSQELNFSVLTTAQRNHREPFLPHMTRPLLLALKTSSTQCLPSSTASGSHIPLAAKQELSIVFWFKE